MYLFVDCETGGLTPDYNLLTLAVIVTDTDYNELGRKLFEFRLTDMRVSSLALAVNNIDVSRMMHNTDTYYDAQRYFELYDKPILAGWNVQFDAQFINAWIAPKNGSHRLLDIQSVFRFMYPNTRSGLTHAAIVLGLETPDHTAMKDTEITLAIARKLSERLSNG